MQLITDSSLFKSLSNVEDGSVFNLNKTALSLLEQIHGITNEELLNQPTKMVELVIDNKSGTLIVKGVQGPVKIFNNTKKLLLINTAKDNQAQFKIGKLKKGRYILEAEHQLFEFVR